MSNSQNLIDISYRPPGSVHPVPGARYLENRQVVIYPGFRIITIKGLLNMSIATLSSKLQKINRSPGWCYYAFQRWYRYQANGAEKRHIRRSWDGSLFWLTGIPDGL